MQLSKIEEDVLLLIGDIALINNENVDSCIFQDELFGITDLENWEITYTAKQLELKGLISIEKCKENAILNITIEGSYLYYKLKNEF